jgi:hypothetical protein
MWCLAARPSHSRAARCVTPPRVASQARLMLVSLRACRDGTEAAAPSCGPPGAGRRRHHNASPSGDPSDGLLGRHQCGSGGCRLLGLRHRDGWQELLSGTTSMVSRARLSGRAGWRGALRTHGSSTVSSAAGPVRIGSPLWEARPDRGTRCTRRGCRSWKAACSKPQRRGGSVARR